MTTTALPEELRTQTDQVFAAIEHRTGHIMAQLRFGVHVLLKLPDLPERAYVTLEDLEAQHEHWKQFVPQSADIRAALAYRLGERYAFVADDIPHITEQLGLNDASVQTAFERLFGKPLSSIYTDLEHTRRASQGRPLVDTVIREELGAEMEWVFLRQGETLFKQGEEGDSLYVVANGRLRVVVGDSETVVMELGSGDTVGEMGVVSGETRSATVYALRDSELCRLSKAGFQRLAEKHSPVMAQIALQMVERVRRMTFESYQYRKPITLAVLPLSPNVPVTLFAQQLAEVLGREGDTLHLNWSRLDGLPLTYDADEEAEHYELSAWINEQEVRHRFILLEAEAQPNGWTRRCLNHADRILLLGMANEQPDLSEVERLLPDNPRISARKELVLLRSTSGQPIMRTGDWLAKRRVDRHHHVALDSPADIERVGRFLRGKALALVFGGGGTRAAAHIGVIRALEEAGIQPDLVGGTSAGALVAAMVAKGWNYQTIVEAVSAYFLERGAVLDYTLPLVSFAAGQRVLRTLTRLFGDTRIEDLLLPFFCLSANLSQAKMHVHREGLLRRAVRASTAIPGVYPPLADSNGDLLVDGAVFNNLPADVAKTLCEGGTVIAVDIASGLGLPQEAYQLDEHLSGWRVFWNRLNPFAPKMRVPNILAILARTTILSSASTRATRNAYADLLLTPPVEQFGLFDLKSSAEMVEASYEYTREQLARWKIS
ncbi:MAG TPA: cyclic nucleotide-binding and patatin-like phospholipase domain-containing protein [Oceanobacillus sp.]|nr:cyclic nucleotide-binding and patatin-like phospholipase domain-containing protein [Oceanobacillus sp.]